MKILSIGTQNFRSFGPDKSIIDFSDEINTIVGENSVGKSNIIKILDLLNKGLTKIQKFDPDDFHNGNVEIPIEVSISCKLDDLDIDFLMEKLFVPQKLKKDFTDLFGNILNIDYKISRITGHQIKIILGKVYVRDRIVSFSEIVGKSSQSTSWRSIIEKTESSTNGLIEIISEEVNKLSTEHERYIAFDYELDKIIAELINKKIIIFSELRSPLGKQTDSPDGGLPTTLYNLKNGDKKGRDRFELIKNQFSIIFPNLKLEMEGSQIVIVKNDKFEIDQNAISPGIIEIINILTYLSALENFVFIFDEPENHLHPHAKRIVSNIIKEASQNNQIICITHSTDFITMNSIDQIILIKDIDGKSKPIKIPKDYFSDIELNKLLRITSNEQKEFLFARKVLLVEGDTEFGAIPIIANRLDRNFDNAGISILSVDSHYFSTFVKILKAFEIPFHIMCDNDALSHIEESIDINKQKIKTSSIIKQLAKLDYLEKEDYDIIKNVEKDLVKKDENNFFYSLDSCKKLSDIIDDLPFLTVLSEDFEGLFKINKQYQELTEYAVKQFRKNKVLQGRYLAENVILIPKEIENVINKIVEIPNFSYYGKKEISKMKSFMGIFKMLEGEEKIQIEQSLLINALEKSGEFSAPEASDFINKMLHEANIYESKQGHYNSV